MLVLACQEHPMGRSRRCREIIEPVRVLGLNCLELILIAPETASARKKRLQIDRTSGLLGAIRGSELCLRMDCTLSEDLKGFPSADRGPLIEALAVDIVKRAVPDRSSVFLCFGLLTTSVIQTFHRLCRDFRNITVEAGPNAVERLSRDAEVYGVSLTPPRLDGLVEADAALFFSPPQRPLRASDNCAVLSTSGDCPLLQGGNVVRKIGFDYPQEYRKTLPRGYPEDTLFAAAVRAGKIPAGDIKIDWVQA